MAEAGANEDAGQPMMMRPLDGIVVVSLEQAIAAPFCTRQLADMGARVIKIERPETGDFARAYDERAHGLSSHFVWTNRSKESLTLDIKAKGAADVLEGLLTKADVLVQNLAPGAAERLGLGFAALHEKFDRLIVCDISGYGDHGPYRDRKAYDLLVQGEAGFLSVTGTPEDPAKAGCSIADIAAGMYAYSGILNALLLRGRTGKGSRVEISMLEALAEWMGYPLYYALDDQAPPARTGTAHATICPYGPFRTGDGGMVLLAVQNEREWVRFCTQVIDRPDLADDPRFTPNTRRLAHREELAELITKAFADLAAQDVEQRLDAAGIANGRLNDLAGVWAHPQLEARQRWATIGSPVGPLPALLPPAVPQGVTPRMDDVPALGAHTDAILSELGFSDREISRLHETGAV